MPALRDEAHHFWKGDAASYRSKHKWVYRRLGKALKCVDCGSTKSCQWANISGRYLRDVNDYKSLCSRCHHKFDAPRWGEAKPYYTRELVVA